MKAPTNKQIEARMENHAIRTCMALVSSLERLPPRWWPYASQARIMLHDIKEKQTRVMAERRSQK